MAATEILTFFSIFAFSETRKAFVLKTPIQSMSAASSTLYAGTYVLTNHFVWILTKGGQPMER